MYPIFGDAMHCSFKRCHGGYLNVYYGYTTTCEDVLVDKSVSIPVRPTKQHFTYYAITCLSFAIPLSNVG